MNAVEQQFREHSAGIGLLMERGAVPVSNLIFEHNQDQYVLIQCTLSLSSSCVFVQVRTSPRKISQFTIDMAQFLKLTEQTIDTIKTKAWKHYIQAELAIKMLNDSHKDGFEEINQLVCG